VGEEDKNYSLENQHDDIARWNTESGHTIVKTYSDSGGKSYTLNRPVFQQMMADAKAGLFDTLVVGRWDRFSRNQDQQAVAVYQLQQYGVKVISATQPTPEGPVGTLIRNNYAFAAELELYNIRERTTGGRKKRTKNGKMLAGPFPLYGYVWADPTDPHGKSRYVPDMVSIDGIPEHAAARVVQRIFEMVLTGMRIRQIALCLSNEVVPTPSRVWAARGRLPKGWSPIMRWSASTLSRMLLDTSYIGKHQAWRVDTQLVTDYHPVTGEPYEVMRKLEREQDDPELVTFDAQVCPALVDEAVFHAVGKILAANKVMSFRHMRDPQAALLRNGFAVCGYCGRNMIAALRSDYPQYRYTCSRLSDPKKQKHLCEGRAFSVACSWLDNIAWQWIIRNFEEPEILEAKFDQWKVEQKQGRAIEYDRLETLRKLIKKAENRRRNYMQAEGDAEDEEMRLEYHQLAQQAGQEVRSHEREKGQLEQVLANLDTFDQRVDDLVRAGTRVLDHLREATYDDKRMVLQAFGVNVRVWSKSHTPQYEIRWRFGDLHQLWLERQADFSVPEHSYSCTT
jgi:DNA invertase Pin-like site-specific DNA recombinase